MAVYINVELLDEQIALAGMSLQDFARYIGTDPATLSRARHGRPVRTVTLHRIMLGMIVFRR